MRITSFTIFNQLTRALNENMRTLSGLSNRLASGKRINNPSEDVSGLMKSMDYKVSINELEQYKKNISEADEHLGFADTVMSSVANALTRARELALQGSTGTQSPQSRAAIAEEVAELRDQVLTLANSKFKNRYLFSGYKTDTESYTPGPGFTYQGDPGEIHVLIDRNVTMAINVPGDIAFSSGGMTFMESLDNLYNALLNNNQAGVQTAIADMDNALDQVAYVRADIGARINHLDELITNQADRNITLQKYLSETEDTDIAETVSEIAKTEIALQSLRQSGVNILSQSLMDFLD